MGARVHSMSLVGAHDIEYGGILVTLPGIRCEHALFFRIDGHLCTTSRVMLCLLAGFPMNPLSTVPSHLRRIMHGASQFMCAALLVLTTAAASATQVDALNDSLDALARSLPQPTRTALAQIPDLKRRLLAARSYAKAGDELTDKWSWSQAQIRAFETSPEYQRMQAAVDELKREFERQNP